MGKSDGDRSKLASILKKINAWLEKINKKMEKAQLLVLSLSPLGTTFETLEEIKKNYPGLEKSAKMLVAAMVTDLTLDIFGERFVGLLAKSGKAAEEFFLRLMRKYDTETLIRWAKTLEGYRLAYGEFFLRFARKNEKMLMDLAKVGAKLRVAREEMPFGPNLELWCWLNNTFEGSKEEVIKAFKYMRKTKLPILQIAEKGGGKLTIITLDKEATTILNHLGYTVGDAGLAIYFRAIREAAEALEKENIRVLAVRTTDQGDEVVVVLRNEEEAKRFLKLAGEKTLALAEKTVGKDFPELAEKLAGFHAEVVNVEVSFKDGKFHYIYKGETYTDIPTLLGKAEVENTWENAGLKKDEIAFLKNLIKGFSRSEAPHNAPAKTADVAEFVIGVRLEAKGKLERILKKVTKGGKKGFYYVEKNAIGPSVLNNYLGHSFTDGITSRLIGATEEVLSKKGIKGEVYAAGPMNIVVRTERALTKEEREELMRVVQGKLDRELAISSQGTLKVRALYAGETKEEVQRQFARLVSPMELTQKQQEALNTFISLVKLDKLKDLEKEELPKVIKDAIGIAQLSGVRDSETLVGLLISKGHSRWEIKTLVDIAEMSTTKPKNLAEALLTY